MCELFGVNTPRKIQLNHLLNVFFSHGDRHPHGWGMAFFENNTVQMEKQAVASTKSARLREYSSQLIMSDKMIAHIRLATKGNMEYENCHPFIRKDATGRTWTLAHNGTIFEGEMMDSYFYVQEQFKTIYRDYLSDKYGRYRMTFSGIHVNFSFSEELLRRSFRLDGGDSFQNYKDTLYLKLAGSLAVYGWILTAVTAASPLLDSSFVEKGVCGNDVFMGLASVRCSELGYWNDFAPVFDYQSIDSYADSIEKYVLQGLLKAPSELYYTVRLKPSGENNLENLRKNGVNHIELRMFDLNPLCAEGLEVKDVLFAQLLMIWLLCRPEEELSVKHQVHAVQNFKNAAHYDLKTVKISLPDGKICSVAQAAINVIDEMKNFFEEIQVDVQEILDFQYQKFEDADNRYAWKIRKQFQGGFVRKGMELAKKRQEECVSVL